ncbi:MAG: glutamine--fructose-6-phosphate transaminase (isomerizing), partial [Litoreibacter sp.]|nr:glutamine--fructose-6-phosphate transaminase (isomerizing) [Litoreibacter sp.]
ATHGAPTVANAHPHRAGRVAVVHNGIIENFKELRAELAELGVQSSTETDTETVVLLAEHYLSDGLDPREAAEKTISRLEGAFALCFLFEGEEDLMIAARKGSPLAIGHGDGEMFVGSDAIAMAPMTSQVTYLEEGDRAILTRDSLEIFDSSGRRANREIRTIKPDAARVEKGGYKHFMAKEIAEQPTVLAEAIAAYMNAEGTGVELPSEPIDFSQTDRLVMVACGTAHIACQVAKYWFEQLAGLPVETDIASEFRYRNPPISDKSFAIFVSQSGETADTLAALRYAQDKAAKIISIVNVPESSIARESDIALPIHAGVEIGVASTKAFSCQLLSLAMLALLAAKQRGRITDTELTEHLDALRSMPGLLNQALGMEDTIAAIAGKISSARDVLFLGRGPLYPLALEGALKLKEISYIHAEGYASGELKHGPIALIDKTVPVVVLAPRDELFEKTVSNMQEVMARGGKVVLITDAKGSEAAGDGVWEAIIMPAVTPILAPILYAIPAQLLSYHAAVAKGTDVDQPRNLAKSVTVE